ncbi:hypothetical protein ACFW1A_12230 [Kitasatospora sp. NPDC058965]|uniref:hypothetical protein n=1 Tax=Kitasatospora sp. NPDC058965 TaxID=3346682 RepID=UPI003688F893
MLRKTIATLALAAAATAGVVTAGPAQAAQGHCISGPRSGWYLCQGSASYHNVGGIRYSVVNFSLSTGGDDTQVRLYANSFSGASSLVTERDSSTIFDDTYMGSSSSLCISEGTTKWHACVN